ncbi:MAG: DUF3990 domain-containing protein [Bacteroidaceae bacterium]|nr:DUF3990 domain-containing protein [Bacteroidaceae bacterium]
MITLYHGSNQEIGEIDLSCGLPDKDFGQGFYLTHLRKQAERMALSKCQRMKGVPTVTVYEFDEAEARAAKLRVKVFDKPSEAWAQFVTNNRHASRTGFTHQYDIVVGPIADDSMALQFRLYEEGYITLRQLARKITFPQQNSQHFFATKRAADLLHKVEVFTL